MTFVTVHKKYSKIPPPPSMYFATRPRRSRVVRLKLKFRFLYVGSSAQNTSEQFVLHIYFSFLNKLRSSSDPTSKNLADTKYITISQNTTKIIALCCTICFTTTCFGPFLQAIFRLCTLGLESNVSCLQIYYIDDEISVIIIQLQSYYGGYVGRLLWLGTGFGCGLAGME